MSTTLKKITTRAKQLRKKHPNAQWKTLVKQAGREYRTGSMPKPRKKKAKVSGKRKYKVTHQVKKVGKRKPAAKSTAKRKTTTATRVRTRTRTVTKYRRVGSSGGDSMMKQLMPVLAIGAVGLIAYAVLKKPAATSTPPLVLTGNASRDSAAQNILDYAQAANLGISAITNLINSLNSMPAAQVESIANSGNLGGSINTLAALPTGGPSINLGG